jgi:hypothetical protein
VMLFPSHTECMDTCQTGHSDWHLDKGLRFLVGRCSWTHPSQMEDDLLLDWPSPSRIFRCTRFRVEEPMNRWDRG